MSQIFIAGLQLSTFVRALQQSPWYSVAPYVVVNFDMIHN